MARTVGIGKQDFEKVRKEHIFYIDKTKFIQEWWENEDDVTLITRHQLIICGNQRKKLCYDNSQDQSTIDKFIFRKRVSYGRRNFR